MAEITIDHRGQVQPRHDLLTLTHVMYALHAFSALMGVLTPAIILTGFLTGWPSIIAVIINYVKRDEVRGTWLESHFAWQLRTFWYAVLWAIVMLALMITFIGIPIAFALFVGVTIWVVYRIIRGWMALRQGVPMPRAPE
jgi:uncharacterized membrane protein